MAFKKTYKKKVPYKRRYKRGNNTGWMGYAKKAFRLATHVAKFVNSESKYYDLNANQAADWNGAVVNLFAPAQGTTAITRTGDSVKVENLTLRLDLVQNSSTELLRVIVFVDKQNSISIGSDLLKTTASAFGVLSPKNDNNKYDTKILWDATFKMTNNYPIKTVDKVIKLDKHVQFSAGTTTVVNNAIKILFIGQTTTGGGNTNCNYYSKITYIDN